VRLSALVDALARRPEKAVTKLEALYRATGDGEVAMELASAQVRAGESEGALATLGAHVDTYPEDVAVRVRLAELLVAADEFAAAAEQLTRVRALDPQRPGIRAALGWSLMRAGRVAEAAPLARAGYEERPDDPAVLHTLGVVLLDEGHADRAEALLKKAMDAGWPGPRLRLDYARALERNGRHGQARSVLEELLALQQGFPERPEAHALLNSLPE
jgi:Flp pilus assembly protein TadD